MTDTNVAQEEVLVATPCPCGHKALDHHGTDGRRRRDAGCHGAGSMNDNWCRCTLTCPEVIQFAATVDRATAGHSS